MFILHDREGFETVTKLDLDPILRRLLQRQINGITADLLDDTEIAIMFAHDDEQSIVNELGWSPIFEPIDGIAYGSVEFAPYWDRLVEEDGWFIMLMTYGSTFASILMIPNIDGAFPELQRMCRAYVGSPH